MQPKRVRKKSRRPSSQERTDWAAHGQAWGGEEASVQGEERGSAESVINSSLSNCDCAEQDGSCEVNHLDFLAFGFCLKVRNLDRLKTKQKTVAKGQEAEGL